MHITSIIGGFTWPCTHTNTHTHARNGVSSECLNLPIGTPKQNAGSKRSELPNPPIYRIFAHFASPLVWTGVCACSFIASLFTKGSHNSQSRVWEKKEMDKKAPTHTQTTVQTLKRRTKNRPNAQSIRNKGIRSCEACFTGKVCTIEGVGCAWPANRAIPLMCCLFLGIFFLFCSKTFLHSAAGPFLPIALVRQQVIRRQASESMTMSCHFRLPAGIACEYLAGSQNHVIRVPLMHNRASERGDSNKVKSS